MERAKFAFKKEESKKFGGIPGTVVHNYGPVNGELMVTLEYDPPVRDGKKEYRHADAFLSQLDAVVPHERETNQSA